MIAESAPVTASQKNMQTAQVSGPLTRRDERRLARRWHQYGDYEAIEMLVRAHLGLVVKIAHEFRNANLPLDDLVQEGNVGLTIASRRFDPERSTRLATYASYWIRACMMEHVVRTHGPVRIGTTRAQRKIFFGLGRARRKLESDGSHVSTARLAVELDVDLGELEAMAPRLAHVDVYLDEECASAKIALGDLLPHESHSPEDQCTRREEEILRHTRFARALRKLDPRERDIITSRHLRESPETLAELGRRFGLSRERVRQIESRAKQRIRQLCGEMPNRFFRHRRRPLEEQA